ncbi:MAG TPA: HAD family hydrolase [Thermoleophilaceae bacterium]|nr:HAD family hydrolase [Thermoleophilaceae bacterium]
MPEIRAVLFDALGTLVRLEPPAPRLRAELRRATGVDVGDEAAERGFAAEIGFYLENHMRGGDEAGLEALRDDCAAVLHEALGVEGLDRRAVRAGMLAALTFTAFPDAVPALRAVRAAGLGAVVVSNWDRSLAGALDRAGLGDLVDGVVSSAEVGRAKPAPEPFRAGLELAGVPAAEALFVGDSADTDVEGAEAAGIRAVLVAREGPAPAGVEAIASLELLPSLF